MSERILKALMQLFALIAHPQSSATERRNMVEKYLLQHLDGDSTKEYLQIFDHYYHTNRKRSTKKKNIAKYTSASSVRILKICTQINEELVTRQKVIVLIQLLEFLHSGQSISDQEMAFINTVADTFNLPQKSYRRLIDFILSPFSEIEDSPRLLTINNRSEVPAQGKHWNIQSFNGKIKILRLVSADMFIMRYCGDSELSSNGQLLDPSRVHILNYGSSIRNPKMPPIYHSDISGTFHKAPLKSRTLFEVKNIQYWFNEKTQGIHDLSFTEKSGKLVGIIGSSGAGKTTLLNVLNGTTSPHQGNVLINGRDVHKEGESLQGVIGHVSQDDLLIESLTVFENLYFNAKLCFGNHSTFQVIRTVLNLLTNIGLFEVRNMKVGTPLDKKISGGQRKRLNIALELIREPSVLFLDEPTSGLSSRDSAKIMDLLKDLSLKGKLVFVVIHQPSSDIYKMFDRLLVLDTGGYLIFNGNPLDAITYFKSQSHRANRTESECVLCGNVDPDEIFNIVESSVLDEYGNPTQTRKVAPQHWFSLFQKANIINKTHSVPKNIPESTFTIPSKFNQFLVFIKRDLLSKLSNKQYLLINLLETPLLAFLLAYIIKFYNVDATNTQGYTFINNSNLPIYLFMAVIVALFIGLTLSAEEIIKDKKILKRERFLNLSKSSYLLSKVFILLGISAIQAFLFTLIGNYIIEIKGMYFHYWLILFSTWSFANLLGLNISDSFKTVINIYILIPFLVIPQLILSGIIVRFDKLNPNISSPNSIPWYGEIITARWAYEALAVKQYKDNAYERNFYLYDKIMSRAAYKKNYWLPILRNKLNENERISHQEQKQEKYLHNMLLLQNEISIENQYNSKIHFNYIDSLSNDHISEFLGRAIRKYFGKLNNYYIKVYNSSNIQKDQFLTLLQDSLPKQKNVIYLKKSYANERLSDFVHNSNELERIIEYKDHLYQKIDPIFQDPQGSLLQAHFYSPRKKIMGSYYDTYWVNLMVIWSMTIFLYITLYFSVLKRILNHITNIRSRIRKKE